MRCSWDKIMSDKSVRSSRVSHAEPESRLRQVIQPTTIASPATTSGGAACAYSP